MPDATNSYSADMWLVMFDGVPQAAYPRKVQAEVYASGFSHPCEIVYGRFASADSLRDGGPNGESERLLREWLKKSAAHSPEIKEYKGGYQPFLERATREHLASIGATGESSNG